MQRGHHLLRALHDIGEASVGRLACPPHWACMPPHCFLRSSLILELRMDMMQPAPTEKDGTAKHGGVSHAVGCSSQASDRFSE